jgi:pentatricopeptide repeat protein
MYFKCGSPVDACTLFGEKNRNVASWNALMSGLIQGGDGMQAFQHFNQMQQEGLLPNNLTFVSILEACSEQNTLSKGHQIHAAMTSSVLLHDEKVETTLLNMYANCGNVEDAEREFYMLPLQNIDSWTAIITAHAQHGHGQKALHLLNGMINEELMPNKATFVSIISACSHDGLVDEVNIIFHFAIQMTSGADLFNCLIDLLARAGKLDEAEALITQMPHDPTVVSWTTLLGACRNQIDVERGERVAKQLFRLDSENPEPYVALSNIYAAAGMGVEAQMMFDRMRGVDTIEKRN